MHIPLSVGQTFCQHWLRLLLGIEAPGHGIESVISCSLQYQHCSYEGNDESHSCSKSQKHPSCRRHAKRLLKYGFDLGPQLSPDSNLPPDDGDSMPVTVRRNAPSNVVLNIADLRNSMLDTALNDGDASPYGASPTDASPKPVEVDAMPDLQPFSPQQQQSRYLADHPQADGLGGCQGEPVGSQGLAHDVSNDAGQGLQGLQALSHDEGRYHDQGNTVTPPTDYSAQDSALPRNPSGSAAVVDSVEGAGPQHQRTSQPYARQLSAMRGSQSRPGLASVRFTEEPDDQH